MPAPRRRFGAGDGRSCRRRPCDQPAAPQAVHGSHRMLGRVRSATRASEVDHRRPVVSYPDVSRKCSSARISVALNGRQEGPSSPPGRQRYHAPYRLSRTDACAESGGRAHRAPGAVRPPADAVFLYFETGRRPPLSASTRTESGSRHDIDAMSSELGFNHFSELLPPKTAPTQPLVASVIGEASPSASRHRPTLNAHYQLLGLSKSTVAQERPEARTAPVPTAQVPLTPQQEAAGQRRYSSADWGIAQLTKTQEAGHPPKPVAWKVYDLRERTAPRSAEPADRLGAGRRPSSEG